MAWITGSEGDSIHSGSASATGPSGRCHAVDPDSGVTACGTATRSLQVWDEVPFIRARMAGGELCATCVEVAERDHATV
jgi:hypothetical protein